MFPIGKRGLRILALFLLAGLLVSFFTPLLTVEAVFNPNPPRMLIPWSSAKSVNINGGNTYNCGTTHLGKDRFAIDFGLKNLTPVVATFDGMAHWDRDHGLGNYIWIDHGDGWVAIYGHLDSSGFPAPGQTKQERVTQGAIIGLSGNSGHYTTGPHLHFAVHKNATSAYSDGEAALPEPLIGFQEYKGFGQYGACQGGRVGGPYYSSKPGGWWLGPSPVDESQFAPGTLVTLNSHAEDNGNDGLAKVNITMYYPTHPLANADGWVILRSETFSNPGVTQADVSTTFQMPFDATSVVVSFDVYSKNGTYQRAPNGIRKYCVPGVACEHDGTINQVGYSFYLDPNIGIDPFVAEVNSVSICDDPGTGQVALFTETDYQGSCSVKGQGEHSNSAATDLPNDSISSIKLGSSARVQLCLDDNLSGYCEWFDASNPNLGNTSLGDNTASSLKVEAVGPTTGCVPGLEEVSLFDGTNYEGACITRKVGAYPNPSAIGLPNDSISSVKVGGRVKVELCRDDNHSNTCEWIDQDASDLSVRSIGTNQASSAKVDYRGGIELCDGTNYGGPCKLLEEGSGNLSNQGFDNVTESIRFTNGYQNKYHVVLYDGQNQTGNLYHIDSDISDLTYFRNLASSYAIYKHQKPGPTSNPSPANGSVFSSSTTNVNLTYDAADESRVHVWGEDYDYWRDWNTSRNVSLTGLTPGIYYWQAQSRNVMGEGPWGPVWTFYINRAPEISDVPDLTLPAGESYSLIVSVFELEGTVPSITAANLPSFATFTDNQNGTGMLTVDTTTNNAGTYNNVTITATDGELSTSDTFNIVVSASNETVFEDFQDGSVDWWLNGSISAITEGGNTFLQFSPPAGGSVEASRDVGSAALANYDSIRLRINLHGLTLLGNDASALYLDQGGWKYVALSSYVQQGLDGWQTVEVPIADFAGFNKANSFARLGFRFWTQDASTIDIDDIAFIGPSGNPTATPTSTPTATPTPQPSGVELLTDGAWNLSGNNGDAQEYQHIDQYVLQGKTTLRITYNLHGLNALGGDASAIIFDQGGEWRFISLSDYGQNGLDGVQIVDIPLSDFDGLDLSQPVGDIHTRFWYSSSFTVDITSIVVY